VSTLCVIRYFYCYCKNVFYFVLYVCFLTQSALCALSGQTSPPYSEMTPAKNTFIQSKIVKFCRLAALAGFLLFPSAQLVTPIDMKVIDETAKRWVQYFPPVLSRRCSFGEMMSKKFPARSARRFFLLGVGTSSSFQLLDLYSHPEKFKLHSRFRIVFGYEYVEGTSGLEKLREIGKVQQGSTFSESESCGTINHENFAGSLRSPLTVSGLQRFGVTA